jgi:hypothetical protein
MPKVSHEEIVNKFIQSESVDFNALGKFVAENGAQLVSSSRGDYGVRFGHYNILACFNIGPIDIRVGSTGIGARELAAEVAGRAEG